MKFWIILFGIHNDKLVVERKYLEVCSISQDIFTMATKKESKGPWSLKCN
jgi:hypothetical protein